MPKLLQTVQLLRRLSQQFPTRILVKYRVTQTTSGALGSAFCSQSVPELELDGNAVNQQADLVRQFIIAAAVLMLRPAL